MGIAHAHTLYGNELLQESLSSGLEAQAWRNVQGHYLISITQNAKFEKRTPYLQGPDLLLRQLRARRAYCP